MMACETINRNVLRVFLLHTYCNTLNDVCVTTIQPDETKENGIFLVFTLRPPQYHYITSTRLLFLQEENNDCERASDPGESRPPSTGGSRKHISRVSFSEKRPYRKRRPSAVCCTRIFECSLRRTACVNKKKKKKLKQKEFS